MMRLNRAGRKQAIVNAIRSLNNHNKQVAYYRGEICRKMGITSQSKIREILHEMVKDGVLISGMSPIDGFGSEIEVFQIAKYEQRELPPVYIEIESRDARLSKLLGII